MVQTGVDLGVVVIDLDPVVRERIADALQVGMGELLVVLFVDEPHDVVEDEDPFDRVAHHLVLSLEPVDDDARAQIDELVTPLRVLDQLDHQVGRASDEARRAERPAGGHHRKDVAMIEDALPVHPNPVERHGGEGVGLHFVLRELIDVLEPVKRVVFARGVVLPELDLGAKH